jgi:signal transduction histidine kinase
MIMRPFASIRARTTLVATAVVAAALLAAIVLLSWLVRANLTASAETQAQRALTTVTERLKAGEPPDLVSDGTTTVQISGPGFPPRSSVHAKGAAASIGLVHTRFGTYSVMAETSLAATDSALTTLMWSWAGIALVILLAVAFTTRRAASSALRPIEEIRVEFADITAHDLHRRVPLPESHDEVDRLAVTMNATLDRLERAVGQHRQFVADASHELRSPIAALRTELELALDHPTRTDWTTSARDALADTRRLERLTDDLLFLSRIDAAEPTRNIDVELASILADQARRRPAVRAHLATGRITVHGSPSHLDRLLTNLLDNAQRHCRNHVDVYLHVWPGTVVIHVDDDGDGIAPTDRDRVFDRFTRLDDARTRDHGGTGLGLAIARDIAHRHAGTLQVSDAPTGGARFTLQLPRSANPSPTTATRTQGRRVPDQNPDAGQVSTNRRIAALSMVYCATQPSGQHGSLDVPRRFGGHGRSRMVDREAAQSVSSQVGVSCYETSTPPQSEAPHGAARSPFSQTPIRR